MDPKALASLDPKLRETYEKVMGTSTAPSTRASGPATTTPPPPVGGTTAPAPKPTPIQSRPASTPPIPSPVSSPLPNIPPPASSPVAPNSTSFPQPSINNSPTVMAQSPLQTSDFAALQATPTGIPLPTAPQGAAVQLGKPIQPLPSPASINKSVAPSNQSSPLIRILYIIASIIFFAVYTIFWLKIFKYPVPFLPF